MEKIGRKKQQLKGIYERIVLITLQNRSEMGEESKLKFCIERRCERLMTREPGDIDVNKLRAQLRCGECDNCRRKDCGKCLFCLVRHCYAIIRTYHILKFTLNDQEHSTMRNLSYVAVYVTVYDLYFAVFRVQDNPKFGGPNRFGKECAQRRCKAVGDVSVSDPLCIRQYVQFVRTSRSPYPYFKSDRCFKHNSCSLDVRHH